MHRRSNESSDDTWACGRLEKVPFTSEARVTHGASMLFSDRLSNALAPKHVPAACDCRPVHLFKADGIVLARRDGATERFFDRRARLRR